MISKRTFIKSIVFTSSIFALGCQSLFGPSKEDFMGKWHSDKEILVIHQNSFEYKKGTKTLMKGSIGLEGGILTLFDSRKGGNDHGFAELKDDNLILRDKKDWQQIFYRVKK